MVDRAINKSPCDGVLGVPLDTIQPVSGCRRIWFPAPSSIAAEQRRMYGFSQLCSLERDSKVAQVQPSHANDCSADAKYGAAMTAAEILTALAAYRQGSAS